MIACMQAALLGVANGGQSSPGQRFFSATLLLPSVSGYISTEQGGATVHTVPGDSSPNLGLCWRRLADSQDRGGGVEEANFINMCYIPDTIRDGNRWLST